MAIRLKKYFCKIILFNFFFFFISFNVLNAQESRGVHRFTWSGGEYALRYEVVFQRMENNNYTPYLREFTAERSIELSLPAGRYRFHVVPYDLLDRPSEPSQWSYVEVRQAAPPGTQPQPQQETHVVQPPAPQNEISPPAPPSQPAPPASQAQPQPDTEIAAHDESVRERSGLFSFIHLYVNAAWSPVLPLYGEDFGVTAAGFIARASAVFEIPFNVSIGPEITAAFDSAEHTSLSIGVNMLALKWIVNERAALGFRFGAALPVMSHHGQINYCIGVSLRWRIAGMFWLDGGVDYLHIFNEISSGCSRPWIGIGLQY